DNLIYFTNDFWKLLFTSILIGFLTAGISVVLAFPFSYLLVQIKSNAIKSSLFILALGPLFFFTIVKIMAFKGMLLNLFYDTSLDNYFVVILGLVYLNIPYAILGIYLVLKDIPINLIYASEDQGYNKFKTLIFIILPYCYQAILSTFALIFMLATTSIIVSNKLVNNKAKLIGNLIDEDPLIASQQGNAILASTISLVILIVVSFFYSIISLIKYKVGRYG
ncbi:MAG: ABC transporter permease, partial [Mycoplasma sp.]|nr:ABC transporter permease [Mycoplasma sp.]